MTTHNAPNLTGDPRTARALIALARLLAEIARTSAARPATGTERDAAA